MKLIYFSITIQNYYYNFKNPLFYYSNSDENMFRVSKLNKINFYFLI